MKLGNSQAAEVLSSGMEGSIDMSIDKSDERILMMILSESLYKDPIGSLIREWTSNAIDAHAEVGVTDAVVVSIYNDNSYNSWFSVQDFGVGISPERVEKILSKYAASTKRNDNQQLGFWGLGFKSGLAYNDSFFFSSNYDGRKYDYMMYKGEEGTKIDLISETETADRNGTVIKILIKNWSDKSEFINSIRKQLCYFENVYYNVSGIDNNFNVLRNPLFKISGMTRIGVMHLCLGNVFYPIDFEKLKISPINIPLGLNFEIADGIEPIPSREDIKYTPTVKELILKKIYEVGDYLMGIYNADNSEVETFREFVVKKQNEKNKIELQGIQIPISEIKKITKITPTTVSLRGVEEEIALAVLNGLPNLLNNYNIVGRINYGGKYFLTKENREDRLYYDYLKDYSSFLNKVIICDESPKGLMREYLKTIHKEGTIQFITRGITRKLAYKEVDRHGRSYRYILGLKNINKGKWRECIKLFQEVEKEALTRIVWKDINDINIDPEWIKKRRESLEIKRIKLEKFDINPKIAYGKDRFVKHKVIPFEESRKHPRLAIYGMEDTPSFETLIGIQSCMCHNKLFNLYLLCKRDFKRVEESKFTNWIKADKFMEGGTKPFAKLATMIVGVELKGLYSPVFHEVEKIKEFSTEIHDMMVALTKYISENGGNNIAHYCNEETRKGIIEVADKHGYYDMEMINIIKKLSKILPKLDFIPYICNYTAYKSNKIVPAAGNAVVDIMKYRKIKLNLWHYNNSNTVTEQNLLAEEIDIEEEMEDEEEEETLTKDETNLDLEEEDLNEEKDPFQETEVVAGTESIEETF